jgi:hypothetical protein
MKSGSPFRPLAVIVGFVVDVLGTVVVVIALSIALGVLWVAQGVKPADVDAKAKALGEDPIFLGVTAGIGCAFTLLGAYVAGRMAGVKPVLHGLGVAVLGDLFGVVVTLAFPDAVDGPFWYVVASFVVPLPVGMLGGYLASFRQPPTRAADDEATDEYPSGHYD